MGLDGSGKSTSIEYVYEMLKKRGIKVKIVRAAYVAVATRGLIHLGKKILMKKHHNEYSDYKQYLENLRKQANRGFVYGVFSFLTTCEFKAQIFFKIRMNRLLGYTLLVDRYIYDNVVTNTANLGLDDKYMEKMINEKWKHSPKADKIIYIKTPVDICFSRKDDIPDPLYLTIREPLYDRICEMYHGVTISGNQSKQDMLDAVMCEVDEELKARLS
jgi:dTMP kinase